MPKFLLLYETDPKSSEISKDGKYYKIVKKTEGVDLVESWCLWNQKFNIIPLSNIRKEMGSNQAQKFSKLADKRMRLPEGTIVLYNNHNFYNKPNTLEIAEIIDLFVINRDNFRYQIKLWNGKIKETHPYCIFPGIDLSMPTSEELLDISPHSSKFVKEVKPPKKEIAIDDLPSKYQFPKWIKIKDEIKLHILSEVAANKKISVKFAINSIIREWFELKENQPLKKPKSKHSKKKLNSSIERKMNRLDTQNQILVNQFQLQSKKIKELEDNLSKS